MNRPHRWFVLPMAFLSASLTLVPATSRAQLVPPGDFRGKSLDQWGFDYSQWSVATDLGGQSPPNTVDGVRYIPSFNVVPDQRDYVTSLTIPLGTPLVSSPFFVFGEKYDDGTEDPADNELLNELIFADTTIRTVFDGNTVLAGSLAEFEARKWGITVFAAPIPYTEPRVIDPTNPLAPKAVASIYSVGFTTIFDGLTLGAHTIRHENNAPFFGGEFSFTYNVTVTPEPASLLSAGIGALSMFACARRRRRHEIAYRRRGESPNRPDAARRARARLHCWPAATT